MAPIFGPKFEGVLVADRYAAYNGVYAKERQACLAQLITRAKELTQELLLMDDASRDKKAAAFCADISAFFSKACAVGRNFSPALCNGSRPRVSKNNSG